MFLHIYTTPAIIVNYFEEKKMILGALQTTLVIQYKLITC